MNTELVLEVLPFGNNEDLTCESFTDIYDPGNVEDLVGRVGNCTKEQVNTIIEQAHQAYLKWSKTSITERKELLQHASALLPQLINEYRDLLVREHGGVMWEAETDFMLGSGTLHLYSQVDEELFAPKHVEEETGWYEVIRKPKGVIGAIVPWNMPIVLTMMKLGPALITGNTIVIKPSPFAPLAITLILKRIADIFPKGVINVVHGDVEVGETITTHPRIRKVAFTGGTGTGRTVMASAAQTIKDVTLELGGNDPAIILEDADFDKIIPNLLKGVFTRSGQICFAVKRIYVPKTRVQEFYDAVKSQVENYKVGHGLNKESTFGPLNNKKQFDFVNALIQETKKLPDVQVEEVGSKLDETTWNKGYYILPHLVLTENPTLNIVTCEQFGPIIPIISYENEEQVIEWANDTELGLGSSVWGTDIDHAYEVALQIESGSTFINSHNFQSLSLGMPFGGVKQSGIGRELSVEETIHSYIDSHAIRYIK